MDRQERLPPEKSIAFFHIPEAEMHPVPLVPLGHVDQRVEADPSDRNASFHGRPHLLGNHLEPRDPQVSPTTGLRNQDRMPRIPRCHLSKHFPERAPPRVVKRQMSASPVFPLSGEVVVHPNDI